jgi:DNA invertase Pin-like site-specific DNA recombinase
MNIGYARVSTDDQNLTLQLAALKTADCRRVFQEKRSGARADRPELRRMLDQVRDGDVVVISRLDRLARSTRDLLELCEEIDAAGAGLRSIAEPWADTTSPAGKMILTVFGGIAEFERSLIRERTRAGRKAAMTRGVKFGRPPKLNAEQITLIARLADEGQTAPQIAETFGVHETTIYRCLGRAGTPTESAHYRDADIRS